MKKGPNSEVGRGGGGLYKQKEVKFFHRLRIHALLHMEMKGVRLGVGREIKCI
jgi:hypothetical protein